MKISRLYTRRIMGTRRSASLAEAAAAMKRYAVGTLLVMDEANPGGAPVGIVTDRDLAIQGFASESSTVGSVMSSVLVTIHEEADCHEALEAMRANNVRRLVVTSAEGALCGILSIDDVVDGLSADLASAAAVLKGDVRKDAAGVGGTKARE